MLDSSTLGSEDLGFAPSRKPSELIGDPFGGWMCSNYDPQKAVGSNLASKTSIARSQSTRDTIEFTTRHLTQSVDALTLSVMSAFAIVALFAEGFFSDEFSCGDLRAAVCKKQVDPA
jgi:hypothetical protein